MEKFEYDTRKKANEMRRMAIIVLRHKEHRKKNASNQCIVTVHLARTTLKGRGWDSFLLHLDVGTFTVIFSSFRGTHRPYIPRNFVCTRNFVYTTSRHSDQQATSSNSPST